MKKFLKIWDVPKRVLLVQLPKKGWQFLGTTNLRRRRCGDDDYSFCFLFAKLFLLFFDSPDGPLGTESPVYSLPFLIWYFHGLVFFLLLKFFLFSPFFLFFFFLVSCLDFELTLFSWKLDVFKLKCYDCWRLLFDVL